MWALTFTPATSTNGCWRQRITASGFLRSLNPFDRDAYLNTIAETDFAALDTTQSAHALLRIRSEFVRRGMG